MPKIIENLESRLAAEAKKQVEQLGYSAVTIRSVASACGVGVGTVYNYYPSKDDLLAAYLLQDWKACVQVFEEISIRAQEPSEVLRCMHDQLRQYTQRNRNVFEDEQAFSSFASSVSRYHSMLRSQIAMPLNKFCQSEFAAEFIAEALLTWTMAGKAFDEIYGMIGKLF